MSMGSKRIQFSDGSYSIGSFINIDFRIDISWNSYWQLVVYGNISMAYNYVAFRT